MSAVAGDISKNSIRHLRIDEVKKVPVTINQSVSLASALGTTFSSSKGISFIVFGLIWMPPTELVLVLDKDLHLRNSRQLEQE